MKCPICGSDKVEYMNNDLIDYSGESYTHECMVCGTFFTRKDIIEIIKRGKQVLME